MPQYHQTTDRLYRFTISNSEPLTTPHCVVSCPDPTQLTQGEVSGVTGSTPWASTKGMEQPVKSQSNVIDNSEAKDKKHSKRCYEIHYPTWINLKSYTNKYKASTLLQVQGFR